MEDIVLEMNRHGFAEETHFTIAYSPVPDEDAPRGIGGVLATVHEITEKVVGERRVAVLRDLGTRAAEAKTAEESCATAAKTFAAHDKDVPFALIYLLDTDGRHMVLAAANGVAEGESISPRVVSMDGGDGIGWPLGVWLDFMVQDLIREIDKLSYEGLSHQAADDGPTRRGEAYTADQVLDQFAGNRVNRYSATRVADLPYFAVPGLARSGSQDRPGTPGGDIRFKCLEAPSSLNLAHLYDFLALDSRALVHQRLATKPPGTSLAYKKGVTEQAGSSGGPYTDRNTGSEVGPLNATYTASPCSARTDGS
jgi:hypothetical protein